MGSGARTPEELETLLEDACIARDLGAVLTLFDERAVLARRWAAEVARGSEEIGRAAATMWRHDQTYVANPVRVVQTGDLALSVGGGINVVRRGHDGAWRFAIALLDLDHPT
jgi:ketosteroid isomerase-like protein